MDNAYNAAMNTGSTMHNPVSVDDPVIVVDPTSTSYDPTSTSSWGNYSGWNGGKR